MGYLPDTEVVSKAWLLSVPGVPADGVSTQLPEDNSTWAASGFVRIAGIFETMNVYSTLRRPVITLETYAVQLNSAKPPWWKANALAEQIVAVTLPTYTGPDLLGKVTLPSAYEAASVLQVNVIRLPRRVPASDVRYAKYRMDLQVFWVRL